LTSIPLLEFTSTWKYPVHLAGGDARRRAESMILCGHRARRRLRRRACLEDATFCWRGSGRPRPLELRPSATADSTSNKPPRTATEGGQHHRRWSWVGACALWSWWWVAPLSSSRRARWVASGVGVILFSLSFGCQKIGSPCASFGPCLRSSAVIVRCSPLQRKPKRLSQQNWGGRVRARWWW